MIPTSDTDAYIAGHWQKPLGDFFWKLQNPSNKRFTASCRSVSEQQTKNATTSAQEAQLKWANKSTNERAQILLKIADTLSQNATALANIITNEVGTPTSVCKKIQVDSAINVFRSTASLLMNIDWTKELKGTSSMAQVRKVPIGVVACITPWNYPLFLSACKIAPALAAGCAVILKPSEYSSRSMAAMAQIIHDSELPAGLFNLLPGDGINVAQQLIRSADVHKVSFTGSAPAGIAIATTAGAHVKPVTLELGGKSASILLKGADYKTAVVGTLSKGFQNAGQTCAALTRLIVPASDLKEIEELAVEYTKKAVVGDPHLKTTTIGPLISEKQQISVLDKIDTGIEEGANLLIGGRQLRKGLDNGFYVEPTIFSGVSPTMKIAQEEIFGPVICILSHDSEEHAIQIANATPYALSAAVWAGTDDQALQCAQKVRAGSISINGAATHPLAPFGGFDLAGYGRERGSEAIESFLTTKTFNIPNAKNDNASGNS